MNRNQGRIPERLACAEQDLRRIQKISDPAAQRKLLGGLLFDLVSLDKLMMRNGCSAEELRRWQTLARFAWGLQEELSPELPNV